MRCFTACFHTLKHKEKQKPPKRTSLKDLIQEKCEAPEDNKLTNELHPAEVIKPIAQFKYENEEQLNRSSRKKVTFNMDVETYECCPTQEAAEWLVENAQKKEKEKKEESEDEADTLSDSITSSSSFISFSPNHRYHKCTSSDDECEDIELNESDLEDDVTGNRDEDGYLESAFVQEESSESLFSISIDSRKQVSAAEMGDKEVNSPLKPCKREMKSKGLNQSVRRDRSQYEHSVLNPVENLSQWKAVKVKAAPPLNPQGKENINLEQETMLPFSEVPNLKQPIQKQVCHKPNTKENEVAVDTSLSSWLVESEKTPNTKNSPGSICNSSESIKSSAKVQDRPILGALTVVDIKQLSASSSPRRSPGPIIGTVGSYWRHTGQAAASGSGSSSREHSGTSSKCIELGEVSRDSTPFHTRLDKALESVL